MNPIDIPDTLKLVDHPTARNTVVTTRNLPIGSVILTEPILTSVLFPDKTGRRCDYCHRSDLEPSLRIRKCTGCGLQWYCGLECMSDSFLPLIDAHLIVETVDRPETTLG